MRQIRKFGTLYTATQNYSDIPDALRNQFATQLTFNTTSERDLEAIGKIDSGYVWVVKELRRYEFLDLTFRVGNAGLVPIFRSDMAESPESEGNYNAPGGIRSAKSQNAMVDYGAIIREKIISGDVVWVSRLAALVEEKYHIDKDVAKLKLRDALLKLLSAGEVQAHKYDDGESGETVSLYFPTCGAEK